MTYDIAVWVPAAGARPLSDEAATEEFERRAEESDERYPDLRPALPQLLLLADLLEEQFPDPPWEELRGALDGDFLYLTIGGIGGPDGPEVERFLARVARRAGVLVYSPMGESVVARP